MMVSAASSAAVVLGAVGTGASTRLTNATLRLAATARLASTVLRRSLALAVRASQDGSASLQSTSAPRRPARTVVDATMRSPASPAFVFQDSLGACVHRRCRFATALRAAMVVRALAVAAQSPAAAVRDTQAHCASSMWMSAPLLLAAMAAAAQTR